MKKNCFLLLFGLVGSTVTWASDFATTVVEATFKVTNSTCGGTCFFVRGEAPDAGLYLVTAAHVFEGLSNSPAAVTLRERRADGSYQRREYSLALSGEGKPLWLRHPTEDAAVLRLSEPLPVRVAALPFSALADEARLSAEGSHICSPVFILTYPDYLEANEACFPVARQGIIASHPLVPVERYHTFLADFTTFHGDSGGPLFLCDAERPLVIGMVVGELRHDESPTMEYEERTIHHQAGLGVVVHSHFIREIIAQAARQAAKDATKNRSRPTLHMQ